jgi:hypothetical protein
VVGLALLGLLRRAPAGEAIFCCVCDCGNGQFRCTNEIDPADCKTFCSGHVNGTSCGFEVSSSICADLPQCDTRATTRAPALGPGGLTMVALLLAGFGAFGLRRAARRRNQ